MLADPATGTASGDPSADRIGVMPDLRRILDSVLNAAPDLYIRDFVGDHGDPHAGAVSASPDIILRPAAVADPQAVFGQGSGTENVDTLGSQAEAGQDNVVYVRVLNRGGSDATNVQATVYWSPPATLVTPNLWNLIGSVSLPSVAAGDVLTVSDALTWPNEAIPATGHYCFVGLIGTDADPAPPLTDFLDWNNYVAFVRNNGNVTWRNFNVVDNVPPAAGIRGAPKGFVALPFLAPGAPDEARRMGLDVLARLPAGARVLLDAPLYLLEALGHRPEQIDRCRGRIAIRAQGLANLGEAVFSARSAAELQLFVEIPPARRGDPYRIAVRQTYEGGEVGRLTWVLAPTEGGKPGRRRKAARRGNG